MADVTRGSREWQQRFRRGLEWGVKDIADAIESEGNTIIADEAIDTSTLLKSSEVQRASRFVRLIKWTAAHAAHAHYGTRPHWPPYRPIHDWVVRNVRLGKFTGAAGETVLIPTFKPKTKKGSRKLGGSATGRDLTARITNAVRAKIARDGTRGVFYATRAADKIRPQAASIMSRAVRRSLDKENVDQAVAAATRTALHELSQHGGLD